MIRREHQGTVVGEGTEHKECVCHRDWLMAFLSVSLLAHAHSPPLPLLMSFMILLFILDFPVIYLYFSSDQSLIPAASMITTGYCSFSGTPSFLLQVFICTLTPGPADWTWLHSSLSVLHSSCLLCSLSWVVPSLPQSSFCRGTTKLPLISFLLPLTVTVQVQAYLVPFPARL